MLGRNGLYTPEWAVEKWYPAAPAPCAAHTRARTHTNGRAYSHTPARAQTHTQSARGRRLHQHVLAALQSDRPERRAPPSRPLLFPCARRAQRMRRSYAHPLRWQHEARRCVLGATKCHHTRAQMRIMCAKSPRCTGQSWRAGGVSEIRRLRTRSTLN